MCCCCVHQIRHDTHTHKFIVCNFSRKKSQNYWLWSFGHNAAKLKMFECSLRLLWAKMCRLCWIIRWNSEIKCENTLRWCIENPWWCYEHWAYPPTCYMVIWPTDNLLAYPFLVNVKVGTSFGYSFFLFSSVSFKYIGILVAIELVYRNVYHLICRQWHGRRFSRLAESNDFRTVHKREHWFNSLVLQTEPFKPKRWTKREKNQSFNRSVYCFFFLFFFFLCTCGSNTNLSLLFFSRMQSKQYGITKTAWKSADKRYYPDIKCSRSSIWFSVGRFSCCPNDSRFENFIAANEKRRITSIHWHRISNSKQHIQRVMKLANKQKHTNSIRIESLCWFQ